MSLGLLVLVAATALATDTQEQTRLAEVPPTEPLEIHAWAEAGYRAAVQPEGPVERGAYLSLARLQVRLSEDAFAAFIQAGADQGEFELLDARATWRPTDALSVRAGRFKTPVSAEFGIPANHLIFVHRSLHTALVPRRALGAEGEGHLRGGRWDLGLQLGLFNPSANATHAHAAGEVFTARTLLETPLGLGMRLAASHWQHNDGALAELGGDAPLADTDLDAALLFEEHGWTGVVEGVLAHPASGGPWASGGVASLAHRFPTGAEELEVEPGAAVEFLRTGEALERVGQVALNFHKADWNLMQTVEWEVRSSGDVLGNAVFLQLQAGL